MQFRFWIVAILFSLFVTPRTFPREWSDTSGRFRVEAELVAVKNGKVFLEKADGSVISVPLDKLSESDRQFLRSMTPKPDAAGPAPSASSPATGRTDSAASPRGVSNETADPQALAQRVRTVFETHCYRCHGQNGATEGGFNFVMNLEKLGKTHVKPNDPPGSLLYERIASHDNDIVMPPSGEKPRPSADDIAAVRKWIEAGAPFIPEEKARDFISNADVYKAMLADLQATPERVRKYNRYFTLTHLYNAGISADELQTYRHAFLKLINSLSWNGDLVTPDAIDPAATILRIDIRQLNWTEEIWDEIVNRNPYGLKLITDDANACYKESGTEMPMVRVDWFVFAASKPPLYHSILALPDSAGELEQMLHVNVAADIRQEQVARAAFNRSGVSRNNRLIERHRLPYGSYWKSYDFGSNTGQKNVFQHPMGPDESADSFHQDGGEIIFSLPNGLQGYMLVGANGQRIDKGPTEIVSDPKQNDRAVMNGLSCMSCHYAGMIPKADEIRPFVEANRKAFSDPESVLVLYPKQSVLDKFFDDDGKRFTAALEKLGVKVVTRTGEPVSTMALRFQEELDLRLAAAEFGLTPEEFDKRLDNSESVAHALGALRIPGGTVKRDSFVEVFPTAAVEFKLIGAESVSPMASIQPAARSSIANMKLPSGRSGTADAANSKAGGEVQRFSDLGSGGVASLAFSPDGKRLAVGKSDRALFLLNIATGGKVGFADKLEGLGEVSALAFTPNGKKLLGGGRSGEIKIWDVAPSGQLTPSGQFAGHTAEVHSIVVSRDGQFVLSGGRDKRARYWQIDTGREVGSAVEFERDVKACLILPDSRHGMATDGETAIQFELSSGKAQRTIKLGRGTSEAVAISPQGDRVLCADGSKLQMWNPQTGVQIQGKMEEREMQWSAIFSPDGKLLLTGGRGKVSVWDTQKQQRIAAIDTADTYYVKTIACSPDGTLIAAIPALTGKDLQLFRAPRP